MSGSNQTKLYIDGEMVDASDGTTFTVVNPTSARPYLDIAKASDRDVDRAVRSARRAYDAIWRKLDPRDRARMLRNLADQLESASAELGEIETVSQGRILRETSLFGRLAAEELDYYAGLILTIRSSVIPAPAGYSTQTLFEPLGVVAAITPWNSPMRLAIRKLGPALAAGNTVVLKPSQQAPLSVLALGSLCERAGLPAGVVNIVTGDGASTGQQLVRHPDVDGITFTGSTEVGREIAALAGKMFKRVSLELGGKSPSIIFADADLDQAAEASLYAFTANQGQVCTAGSRILVESSKYEEVLHRLATRASELAIGDPLQPDVDIGPLVSRSQLERVERIVGDAVRDGATVVTGGRRPDLSDPLRGWFYAPTLVEHVKPNMGIAQEEVFGPVSFASPFSTEDEAVTMANAVDYGLSAAIWTTDVRRARRMTEQLDVGLVFVNTMNKGILPGTPVAGRKASGMGVENGFEGVISLSQLKTVVQETTPSDRPIR